MPKTAAAATGYHTLARIFFRDFNPRLWFLCRLEFKPDTSVSLNEVGDWKKLDKKLAWMIQAEGQAEMWRDNTLKNKLVLLILSENFSLWKKNDILGD